MKLLKSLLCLSGLNLSLVLSAAAQSPAPAAADTQFHMGVNEVLAGCAFLLLVIACILGATLRSAILYYHDRKQKEAAASAGNPIAKTVAFLLVLLSCSLPVWAQDVEAALPSGPSSLPDAIVMRWVLYIVIAVEVLIILLFARWIRFFTGVSAFRTAARETKSRHFDFAAWWNRLNRFRPIEQEASLDTGHSYDGIRELNNVTPPWFIFGFVLSIIFGLGYLWRYHVAKAAPMQIEEYNIAVAEAKVRQEEYLRTQANNVDEHSVVLLDDEGKAAGQALFVTNCVACHGDKGQGGVGPNLTDNYWLHGGSLSDIFKSVKYGWADKGMKSWKEDFSPNQIAQISSFIVALKGTNPPGGKEAQGELYEETAATSGPAADSVAR